MYTSLQAIRTNHLERHTAALKKCLITCKVLLSEFPRQKNNINSYILCLPQENPLSEVHHHIGTIY
jgi:hypothetical protein